MSINFSTGKIKVLWINFTLKLDSCGVYYKILIFKKYLKRGKKYEYRNI